MYVGMHEGFPIFPDAMAAALKQTEHRYLVLADATAAALK